MDCNCGSSSILITPVVVNDNSESFETPESQNPLWLLVDRNLNQKNLTDYLTPSFYRKKKEAQREVTFSSHLSGDRDRIKGQAF